jgi:hypothetical protein
MNASFVCPACHAESHHPDDVRNGYCGACHDFTGIVPYTDWTDAEWLMVIKTYPPGTDTGLGEAAVWRWRKEHPDG